MSEKHISVLLKETIEALNIKEDGVYIDCTAGAGGHSSEILKRLGRNGKLLMIDRDPTALELLKKKFEDDNRTQIIKSNFSNVKQAALQAGITKADGILYDIGVSSMQLDTFERGFSYKSEAILDMRMSLEGLSAKDVINTYDRASLIKILYSYGEEKFAPRIADNIIKAREKGEIETTTQLAEIVKDSLPEKVKRMQGHPAKKTFQAIRIEVNGELDELKKGLSDGFELLNKNGIIAVISFHSLEDRIVKQTMNKWCEGCICPKDFPVCVCGRKPQAKLLLKHGVTAGEDELKDNNRSRSARLRACKKL